MTKICPVCGNANKEKNKYCNKCGAKFEVQEPAFDALAFENEKTVFIGDDIVTFENEETMILDDQQSFENEETTIFDDHQSFENEETVVIDDHQSFENEETVILGNSMKSDDAEKFSVPVFQEDPPKAPDFGYAGEIPVYRDPQNDVEPETAYIDHLRRLKGLLDDGIINEYEYEQKKQQILGLNK